MIQQREQSRIDGTHSDYPVASMGFSSQMTRALLDAGLDTIGKVCDAIMHEADRISKLPGFDSDAAQELISILQQYGVKFESASLFSASCLCAGKNVTILRTGWDTITRDSPLGSLDLSIRVYNGLNRAGLKTVRQFLDLTGEEKIRNIGAGAWAEIKEVQEKIKTIL